MRKSSSSSDVIDEAGMLIWEVYSVRLVDGSMKSEDLEWSLKVVE